MIKKIGLLLLSVTLALNVVGCEEKEEEKEKFEGYGNTISNLDNIVISESQDSILFWYANILYNLDKDDETVELICQDPVCKHDIMDIDCLSAKFITNLQYYDGAYYYADIIQSGYYEMKGDEVKEIYHRDDSNAGHAFAYNKKLYYTVLSESNSEEECKDDIVRKDIEGDGKEIIPVGEHIYSFYPVGDQIIVLTMEDMLYSVEGDSNEKKLLTEDKVSSVLPDGDYLYYTYNKKSGLYRMKLDGTGEEKVVDLEGAGALYIGPEYIYISVDSFSDVGMYCVDKDGKNIRKISDRIMEIATFEDWDKIVCFYSDVDISQNREFVIMNADGSDEKTVLLPEVVRE